MDPSGYQPPRFVCPAGPSAYGQPVPPPNPVVVPEVVPEVVQQVVHGPTVMEQQRRLYEFTQAALKRHLDQLRQQQMYLAQYAEDFKLTEFPLSRIKRVMKNEGHAKLVSAHAPAIMAKACEMLIEEMTMRSWVHTQQSLRSTIRRSDLDAVIAQPELPFGFLSKPNQAGLAELPAQN